MTRPIRFSAALLAVVVFAPFVSTHNALAMDTGSNKDSIENYLGLDASGLTRLQRRQEESIAVCMKKEGFSYFPENGDIPADAVDGGVSNRKSFVEKYGYGISTLVNPPTAGSKSKNQAYVGKLSSADKRAYNVALIGGDPEKVNGNDLSALNPKTCIAKVTAQLFGDLGKLQGLFAKYSDVQKRIDASPKVVRAMRDWSGCMKKSGYTYVKDSDVGTDLQSKLTKLYKTPPSGLGAPDNSTIDTPGLAALKKQELATAGVDFDCSKKYLPVRDQVSGELQKKFIAENQAGVDQFKKVLSGR